MQLVCTKCNRTLDYSGDRPSFCAYCGQALAADKATPAPVRADEAPTQVGPPADAVASTPRSVGAYRILRQLGSGGMGAVYDAEDASGRRVALKLIASEFVRSADAVERFRQEGRIASMITHPRCVFVLAVDEDAGRPYIVMERMPGATLKDLVDREGPLPPERAIALILDVIEGLQEAHRLEVIHRDVKPSNCFLDTDGRVKVGDFGLAKSLVKDAHLTRTGAFVGTPHFASPEQLRGEGVDARTDVYSTAATLYYLLAGKPPFHGSDSGSALARILTDPPPRIRRVRPELSSGLEHVILRGLERDLERRWSDMQSFREALAAVSPRPRSWLHQGVHVIASASHIVLVGLGAVGAFFGLGAAPAKKRSCESSGGWLLSFLLSRRLERGAQSGGLPERIAGFTIRGALKWTPTDKVLLGEDAALGRRAFLWLRPQSAPPLTAARRNVGRRTRLRWLASGKQGDLQWDALLAPSGSPLPDFVQTESVLPWPEARAVLLELANELVAACVDGTLTQSLSPAQVWIHADGRIQLADLAVRELPPPQEKPSTDEQRALALLCEVAELLLEGKPRAAHQAGTPIRATVPDDAGRVLDRLLGAQPGFETLREAQAALASTAEFSGKR